MLKPGITIVVTLLLTVFTLLSSTTHADQGKALLDAISKGDPKEVQKLLLAGVDINARDEHGATALMKAAERGRLDIVKLLLEKGADVGATSKDGRTALLSAVGCIKSGGGWFRSKETADVVRELIEKGGNVNAKTEDGATVLMGAALLDEPDIVRKLLEKGAEVNPSDKSGKTALMCAGNGVAKLLLDKGADISAKDKHGKTALMCAVDRCSLNMVILLLDKGADCNAKDNKGATALMFATRYGWRSDVDMVRILLAAGAEINAKDNDGGTALMTAVKGLDGMEATKVLLEKGANVNAKDKDGKTALMHVFYAFSHVTSESGQMRREGSTSISDFGKGHIEYGSRALLPGQSAKCKELAQLLLEYGADANAMDNEGRTALSRVFEPVIEVEADKFTEFEEKGTVLALKIKNGTVRVKRDPPADIVELLRAHGAKE